MTPEQQVSLMSALRDLFKLEQNIKGRFGIDSMPRTPAATMSLIDEELERIREECFNRGFKAGKAEAKPDPTKDALEEKIRELEEEIRVECEGHNGAVKERDEYRRVAAAWRHWAYDKFGGSLLGSECPITDESARCRINRDLEREANKAGLIQELRNRFSEIAEAINRD